MRMAGPQRLMRRAQQRSADTARGVGHSIIRLSAGRAADMAFADTRRLPAQISYLELQNSAGQNIFIPGYSDPSGGDVSS